MRTTGRGGNWIRIRLGSPGLRWVLEVVVVGAGVARLTGTTIWLIVVALGSVGIGIIDRLGVALVGEKKLVPF